MTSDARHTASTPRQPQPSAHPARLSAAAGTSWAERLAAWAERQPSHRRLGCWTAS